MNFPLRSSEFPGALREALDAFLVMDGQLVNRPFGLGGDYFAYTEILPASAGQEQVMAEALSLIQVVARRFRRFAPKRQLSLKPEDGSGVYVHWTLRKIIFLIRHQRPAATNRHSSPAAALPWFG